MTTITTTTKVPTFTKEQYLNLRCVATGFQVKDCYCRSCAYNRDELEDVGDSVIITAYRAVPRF
jgi:hypothetical protein